MTHFTDHSDSYNYLLPEDRIAQFPLSERDASKLLVFKNSNLISDHTFKEVSSFLPTNSLLMFNETKVIRARLVFQKESGAQIELFCLEPLSPSADFYTALSTKSCCKWKCFIGNAKKWKSDTLTKQIIINNSTIKLEVTKQEILNQEGFIVEFNWDNPEICFGEILEAGGNTPLPPYIKRKANTSDDNRYQTIYASKEGSVAAPTAGLHFTDTVLSEISKKQITTGKVILHVGAGTFKPINDTPINEHVMHYESIEISRDELVKMHSLCSKNFINVGTTTVRTLESIYWFAVKISVESSECYPSLIINQWDPYQTKYQTSLSRKEALEILISYLDKTDKNVISGQTQLMIVPGYRFMMTDILITNFHQPKSTLLLLVSAFTNREWKKIYQHALNHEYRFLSYGDSCLLLNKMKL